MALHSNCKIFTSDLLCITIASTFRHDHILDKITIMYTYAFRGSVCWSWVVGPKSWVVVSKSWVVGPKSWVVVSKSWVVGPKSWVVSCKSWVVVRGSQVVGRGFQVLGRRSWVIDWKGSALARRRFFGIPSISKQTLSSLQRQIIHTFKCQFPGKLIYSSYNRPKL